MPIPIAIDPNPLVNATVELRIVSTKPSSEIFPLVYPKIMHLFPKLGEVAIPKDLRQGPLEMFPDYILTGDDYSMSFGNKVISFEIISGYKTWKHYYPVIEETIGHFFELNWVQSVNRIGVRFMNILDQAASLEEICNVVPPIYFKEIKGAMSQYRTTFNVGENQVLLQFADNSKAVKANKTFSGVYIDSDSAYNKAIAPGEDVFIKINQLHSIGKEVFFSLLKPEFIETLNPKYE